MQEQNSIKDAINLHYTPVNVKCLCLQSHLSLERKT